MVYCCCISSLPGHVQDAFHYAGSTVRQKDVRPQKQTELRQVRASCPREKVCRSKWTECSIAGFYIIFPGPVISDNCLINEVGLLPIEYTGPEGRGETRARRVPLLLSSLGWSRHVTCVLSGTGSSTPNSDTFRLPALSLVHIFFYISLLIFRYFPLFYLLTPLQFKTRNHIEVEGDNA